ncbi:MAG: cytochrome c oxidase subunit II [Blastocatellia bacterium]
MSLSLLFQVPFMPEQASKFAEEVDLLYILLWLMTAFFTVGIALAAGFFMLKYKRKSLGEIPEQIEGAMKLELTWTIIPFIISLGIFAWGAKIFYQMYTPPADALEIFVTGKQWMWRAQHPDGQREINTLHVPIGRRVKLTMTSEDVIHAYFIPAFRTKADVVPGRYTMSWFEATKAGNYHLFCAEYCGTEHSGMIGTVTVMEPADYQAWLSGVSKESPIAAGQKLFASQACITCHLENGQGRGPRLNELYGKTAKLNNGTIVNVDDAYIRESILNPTAKVVEKYEPVMPVFQGQVSEEQIQQLIAYIKSIGPKDGGAAQANPAVSPAAKPAAAKPVAEPVKKQ